jgi:uncharacterized Fe-S cluster protein YjdI
MPVNKRPVVKEYATEEIVVEWEPRLCYHSLNCVRSLPQVFDKEGRPWIKVDAASADEVEATVRRCPSGALRSRRLGAPVAAQQQPLEIRASPQGPLLIRGGVRILDDDGTVLYEGERAALCRCGGSSNKPFCDGTHKTNGFEG